jgi:transcriptional regulator with XRE-family HTH domain
MSETIPLRPVERLWNYLKNADYRRGFAVAHVGGTLAAQIYTLRTKFELTQSALAKKIGSTQSQVSNWESDCETVSLSTLHKIAEAFDVGLLVKFVPFSELAREATATTAINRAIPSFEEDTPIPAKSIPPTWEGGPSVTPRAKGAGNFRKVGRAYDSAFTRQTAEVEYQACK